MKPVSLLVFLLMASVASAADWTIRWEAAKGELTCKVPYDPRPLDYYLFALPSGHFEASADIKAGVKPTSATVKVLGEFNDRRIVAVELKVKDSYYSRYYVILAEVEAGRFMPIYVHQYAFGAHGHGEPVFQSDKTEFSVTISSFVHGTSPSSTSHRVRSNLKSPPVTEQAVADQRPADGESKAQ